MRVWEVGGESSEKTSGHSQPGMLGSSIGLQQRVNSIPRNAHNYKQRFTQVISGSEQKNSSTLRERSDYPSNGKAGIQHLAPPVRKSRQSVCAGTDVFVSLPTGLRVIAAFLLSSMSCTQPEQYIGVVVSLAVKIR